MIDLKATFDKYEDDFLLFERIVNPPHRRPDICAFIVLDRLVPGTSDMVVSAEHDEIWLDVDVEALASAATDDDILLLSRCGVRLDDDVDSLAMYV